MQFGANVNKISRYIVHLGCYYIAWIGCMYLAAQNNAWSSSILVIFFTSIQVIFECKQKGKLPGLRYLIILFVIFGGLIDSLGVYFGFINFAANSLAPYITSPWMLTIWANFAVIIYCLIPELLIRPFLLAALCLPGFAAAYYIGAQIGAVNFPYGDITCIGIGVIWSILLPICGYIYSQGE